MPAPAISVVVPTCRRPALLRRCLKALMRQAVSRHDYEILVVDDAATEETRDLVERLARRLGPAMRYLPAPARRGPAAARNLGWRNARGGIIAFTDDDCLPAPTWLIAGRRAIEAGCDAVSGRVIVPRPLVPTDYERTIGWLEQAEFLTANCFCRREALERVGGFDERFTAAWREDSDLQFSLLEAGARIGRAEHCLVYHPVRRASFGISLREQRKSRFNALLFRKHRALYRDRIQSAPPWRYYAIVAALGVAVGAALAGVAPVAIGALLVWLGLTTAFCLERLRGTKHSLTHVIEMALTSALIPPLAVFWRLHGTVSYRVLFL